MTALTAALADKINFAILDASQIDDVGSGRLHLNAGADLPGLAPQQDAEEDIVAGYDRRIKAAQRQVGFDAADARRRIVAIAGVEQFRGRVKGDHVIFGGAADADAPTALLNTKLVCIPERFRQTSAVEI